MSQRRSHAEVRGTNRATVAGALASPGGASSAFPTVATDERTVEYDPARVSPAAGAMALRSGIVFANSHPFRQFTPDHGDGLPDTVRR